MKQDLRPIVATAILIFLLAGCGQFSIDSQVSLEATPTAVPASTSGAADDLSLPDTVNASPDLTNGPTARAPRLPRIGLAEVLILSGASIVASLLLGALLLLTGRPTVFDSRPMQDDQPEPTTLRNIFQFRPTLRAVVLSLCAWTVTLGVLAVAFVGGLALLARTGGGSDEDIQLTVPTSILLESGGDYVWLPVTDLTCSLGAGTDREDMRCEMAFDGQAMTLDVVLTAGTYWECAATYDGQDVPCRASFSDEDLQTFIVLNSTLELSEARLQQLAASQPRAFIQAADWPGLVSLAAGALALAAFVVLWRRSHGRIATPSRAKTALAATYSLSVSAMLFGTAYYVAILSLLLLGVLD
jgi:hypothetical protein